MKTLFILTGSTGVGKTESSLSIAEHLGCPVINADSRQIYRDIPIGTAAPTLEEQQRVPHYFVGSLALNENYSAACYESQALSLINRLFLSHDNLLLTGGSMLYIDVVSNGIDDLPTVSPEIRQYYQDKLLYEGLPSLVKELEEIDPIGFQTIDARNPRRVVHALEISRMSGQPYSSFLHRKVVQRPFRIIKIGLCRPREELYDRIDRRVELMMERGLLEEARGVYPNRHLNALNTVGYKELFSYFDGKCTLDEAIQKIKHNTHVYARKQITWFSHDSSVVWFRADHCQNLLQMVLDLKS